MRLRRRMSAAFSALALRSLSAAWSARLRYRAFESDGALRVTMLCLWSGSMQYGRAGPAREVSDTHCPDRLYETVRKRA